MAMTRSAWAERELMMCCWMRNCATSTMLLKDLLRIFSAQSQVRAQAASITSLVYDCTSSDSSDCCRRDEP